MSEDERIQAILRAQMRENLRCSCTFRTIENFTEIAYKLQKNADPCRELISMVEEKKSVIGMQDGDQWIFPVCQIDPNIGEVYAALSPVIRWSYQLGYNAWEILLWLTSPSTIPWNRPGTPVDMGGVFDSEIFLAEMENRKREIPPRESPLDCLLNREIEKFVKKAIAFIGKSPDIFKDLLPEGTDVDLTRQALLSSDLPKALQDEIAKATPSIASKTFNFEADEDK